MHLLQRAADAGEAKAMTNLGLALLQGLGLPAEAAASAHWLQRAAEAGSDEAREQLRRMGR